MENIEEKTLFNEMKKNIYKLCPIKKNKTDSDNIKKIELIITFYFYKEENNSIKMQTNIKKRNRLHDSKSEYDYLVDREISKETFGKLVSFILKDFPNIRSLDTHSKGFDLEFSNGPDYQEQTNIGCNDINIRFTTSSEFQYDFASIFLEYLDYIYTNFPEQTSRNNQFRNEYKKYCIRIKTAMINFYTSEELKKRIENLSNGELIKLLYGIDNETFFNLFGEFVCSKAKTKTLELNRIDIDSNITKY